MGGFQENIGIIDDRWPIVAAEIVSGNTVAPLEWLARGADKTLIVSGLQLTSAYDRRAEAVLQSSLIPRESDTATVYGLALGDLPKILLERRVLSSLRVVIMNPELAAICCSAVDMGDWLSDPRVSLYLAWEEPGISYPFAAAPTALRLAVNRAAPLRDAVVMALAHPFQERHFREMDAVLDEQLQVNLRRLDEDGDVASLFGTAAEYTVVVVAGGPTASEQFEMIRSRRDTLRLIVVSTALRSVLAAGLSPDAVVVVDPQQKMANHFDGLEDTSLSRVPLVYIPTVHPDVIDRWPGSRLVAYLNRPRFAQLSSSAPRGTLFCSGSVTHTAVDLAVRMAAREVILVGADFSFPEGRRHVEGAVESESVDAAESAAHPFVINGSGEQTPSRTDMVGFLRDLERYIASHPDVIFWNTGRAGAEISGAAWLDEAT